MSTDTPRRDDDHDERDERGRAPGVPPHEPTPRDGDDEQDERSRESFPSSDPPSTGGPGV